MLLIDSVRYELWTPDKEVEQFHPLVKEHILEIFGNKSRFIEGKNLQSEAGKGSRPDGIVLIFWEKPQWHIVEMELSSHQLYDHIVNQVGRFINGINNTSTQRKIVDAIYREITENKISKAEVEEAIGSGEIYKFLSDLISKPPILTIIIEKKTKELDEAINLLRYSPIEIVEFQTYIREGAERVHAHLFEQLNKPLIEIEEPPEPNQGTEPSSGGTSIGGRVKFEELVSAGLIKDGQILYFYNTRPFTNERAQVIASSNRLKYEADGKTYSKSELAKILLIKHGFKHDEYTVQGPKFWQTEGGKFLVDLEEQVRNKRGDRK